MNEDDYSRRSIFAHTGPVDPDLFIEEDLSDLDLVDSPPKPSTGRKRWKPKLLGASFFRKVFNKKKKLAAQLLTRNDQGRHFLDDDEEDFLTDREGNNELLMGYDEKESLDPRSTYPMQLVEPESVFNERKVRFSDYAAHRLYYPERKINEVKVDEAESTPMRRESNRKTRHKPRKRRKQKRQPSRRYQDLHDEDGDQSWESLSEAESDDNHDSIYTQSRPLFSITSNKQIDEQSFGKRRESESPQQRHKDRRISLSPKASNETQQNQVEAVICIQKIVRGKLLRLRQQLVVHKLNQERQFMFCADFDDVVPVHCDQRREAAEKIQKAIRFYLIRVRSNAKEQLPSACADNNCLGCCNSKEEHVPDVPPTLQAEDHESLKDEENNDKRIEAANKIQKLYRSYSEASRILQRESDSGSQRKKSVVELSENMERTEMQKDAENRSAVIIQKLVRRFLRNNVYCRTKLASIKIQKLFRQYSNRFNRFRLQLLENRLKLSEQKRESEVRSIRNQLPKRKELYKVQTEIAANMHERLADDHEMKMNLYLEEYKNLCTENANLNKNLMEVRDENKSLERSINNFGELSARVELRIKGAAELQEKLRSSMPQYEDEIVKLQNSIDIHQNYCLMENMLLKIITVKTGSILEVIRENISSKTKGVHIDELPGEVPDCHSNYSLMRLENEASDIALRNFDSMIKTAPDGSVEIFFDSDQPDPSLDDHDSLEILVGHSQPQNKSNSPPQTQISFGKF